MKIIQKPVLSTVLTCFYGLLDQRLVTYPYTETKPLLNIQHIGSVSVLLCRTEAT